MRWLVRSLKATEFMPDTGWRQLNTDPVLARLWIVRSWFYRPAQWGYDWYIKLIAPLYRRDVTIARHLETIRRLVFVLQTIRMRWDKHCQDLERFKIGRDKLIFLMNRDLHNLIPLPEELENTNESDVS